MQTPQPYILAVKFLNEGIVLGGLDCVVTHMCNNITKQLYAHDGFVSAIVRQNNFLLSTSADKTAILFDLDREEVI